MTLRHYNDIIMGTMASQLFKRRSEKTSRLRVTGLCEGNSPETGEFPTQRASKKSENVSIWWRHHEWKVRYIPNFAKYRDVSWWCCLSSISRADSRFAPSQWETSLQSNAVSHWLGANLESALIWDRAHLYVKMLYTSKEIPIIKNLTILCLQWKDHL